MITINKEPVITVGILTEKKIDFELYGDFSFPGSDKKFSGTFKAEIIDDKICIDTGTETIEAKDEIQFNPEDISSDSFLLKEVTIGKKFHWERKEKERFNGSIKLKKDKNKIVVINIIPIEKYLISVISSEMNSKSSIALLKAHAIVSRSWFLAQMEKSKEAKKNRNYTTNFNSETEHIKWYDREEHTLFDVCADDHCQRYQGITKVVTGASRQAVEQTKGMVLISDKMICDARYGKSCGGVTEAFENVWEPVKYSYLTSVVDYKFEPENYNLDFSDEKNALKWIKGNPSSFCNTNDNKILSQVLPQFDQETKDFFRWKVEYLQEEISEIIRTKSGIDFGDIIDLIPVERGASARLVKLKIVGSKKTLVVGKELEIRKFLSPSHLYSSAFVVEKTMIKNNIPGKFTLYGAGWGHGVGLCQIGAAVMSSKGYDFDEILLHYFTNAKIKKIY